MTEVQTHPEDNGTALAASGRLLEKDFKWQAYEMYTELMYDYASNTFIVRTNVPKTCRHLLERFPEFAYDNGLGTVMCSNIPGDQITKLCLSKLKKG